MIIDNFEYMAFSCHSRACITYSSFPLSVALVISLQPSVDVLDIQDVSNVKYACVVFDSKNHLVIANVNIHAGSQKGSTVLLCVKFMHRNSMPQFALMKENQYLKSVVDRFFTYSNPMKNKPKTLDKGYVICLGKKVIRVVRETVQVCILELLPVRQPHTCPPYASPGIESSNNNIRDIVFYVSGHGITG